MYILFFNINTRALSCMSAHIWGKILMLAISIVSKSVLDNLTFCWLFWGGKRKNYCPRMTYIGYVLISYYKTDVGGKMIWAIRKHNV
jgi:hypothetical protein